MCECLVQQKSCISGCCCCWIFIAIKSADSDKRRDWPNDHEILIDDSMDISIMIMKAKGRSFPGMQRLHMRTQSSKYPVEDHSARVICVETGRRWTVFYVYDMLQLLYCNCVFLHINNRPNQQKYSFDNISLTEKKKNISKGNSSKCWYYPYFARLILSLFCPVCFYTVL